MLNSFVIYNKFYTRKPTQLATFIKSIASSLLQVPANVIDKPTKKAHELRDIPRKANGKIVRKRCSNCYEKISRTSGRKEASLKCKQVHTECLECQKPFCLECFNNVHENNPK